MATRKTTTKSPAKTVARKTAKPEGKATAAAPKPPATETPRPAAPRKAKAVETAAAGPPVSVETPTDEERYRWIAHAAYLRAERRGFAPGQEVEDWLAAEAEFMAAFGLNPG